MPADVVRSHGFATMMALRDGAKFGIARMYAMGHRDNAAEATFIDGVTFGVVDLLIADSYAD